MAKDELIRYEELIMRYSSNGTIESSSALGARRSSATTVKQSRRRVAEFRESRSNDFRLGDVRFVWSLQ
jgi:hypothetical protein